MSRLGVPGVGVAIAVAVALVRLARPTPLELLDLKALDLRHVVRGALADSGAVVVAAIDEASLAELGRWPWPRHRLATLVDRLSAAGARAIGFDVIFDQPETTVELDALRAAADAAPARSAAELVRDVAASGDDTRLAAAFRASKRVVLGEFFEF